jgi:hypothetical protein
MRQACQLRFGTHDEPLKDGKKPSSTGFARRVQGVPRRQTGGEQDSEDRGLLSARQARG